MTDYQGIGIIIAATAAAIPVVGGFVLQVLTFAASAQRDKKLAEVHTLVNGMSEAKERADTAVGFANGRAEGILAERHDPHANPPTEPRGPK